MGKFSPVLADDEEMKKFCRAFMEDDEADDYLIQEADAAWEQYQYQIYLGDKYPGWNKTYSAFYLGYCIGRKKSPS